MKVLATILLSLALAISAAAQTSKKRSASTTPKTPATKTKSQSTQKSSDRKAKPSAKNSPSKAPGAKSSDAKLKAKAVDKNPAKPKPVERTIDDSAELAKVRAISDASEGVLALRKFIHDHPRSEQIGEARSLLVTAVAGLGNAKLQSGDLAGADELYLAAVNDAAAPISDQLFTDILSKFPTNLYFRGGRDEALALAKLLETRTSTPKQLTDLATFYMSVENGSEAKRLAEKAIALDPQSSAAYQTLGLALRIDFQLEASAAAYAKAVELDPASVPARRGLAEMKRSIGKSDEAVALYREILAKDASNLPAETGLILALFDSGKTDEAEAEMARSVEANPGNVILLAGAAYWYAAHQQGDKAVALAQQAIASDPRYIWSHIALARGYLDQKNPAEAERTLLAARRYGNFPTLEYEIASARFAAGLYREAADELAKSFSVKDALVQTRLGGRVLKESIDLADLVGYERRASIFTPASAELPANSQKLAELLALSQRLAEQKPQPEAVAAAANTFVSGDDAMKIHREIYTASQLLQKNVALPTALEIVRSAPKSLDAGLDVAAPSTAVMASELYESRTLAAARGDYVNVPALSRSTISDILRGRIEEITGWTLYQMDDPANASVHLRRAVSVLPPKSIWWRETTWRLGSSLALEGKTEEALDTYIRAYKSAQPDALKYSIIEALYKRVNGHTLGLDSAIGPNPSSTAVAQAVESTPATPKVVPAVVEPTPTPEIKTVSTPVPVPVETPAAVAPTPTPVSDPIPPTPETKIVERPAEPTPSPTASPEIVVATPEPTASPVEKPVDERSQTAEPLTAATPQTIAPTPEIKPSETPEALATPTESPSPSPTPDVSPTPVAEPSPAEVKSSEPILTDTTTAVKPPQPKDELFPSVVITIPRSTPTKAKTRSEDNVSGSPVNKPAENQSSSEPVAEAAKDDTKSAMSGVAVENTPVADQDRPRIIIGSAAPAKAIKPCRLTVSEDSITLQNGGGDLAMIVGRDDDADLDGLTAVSSSPENVSVRREVIDGVTTRALFVVRARAGQPGIYSVEFSVPCGKKVLTVNVK